jgi:hypothetical protein
MDVIRNVIVMSLMSIVAYGFVVVHKDASKPSANSVVLQEEGLIVVVSGDKKCISAFSIERNLWSKLEFDTELSAEATPVLYKGMVAIKNREYIYGYSAKKGAWDKIKVESESESQPILGNDCIHVKTKNALYVFGINSVYWTAVNLTTGDSLKIGEASVEPTHATE